MNFMVSLFYGYIVSFLEYLSNISDNGKHKQTGMKLRSYDAILKERSFGTVCLYQIAIILATNVKRII